MGNTSDWNPAVDKQAAARCWRDGQKKRCFTYRFLATGTVEEKIFQRQLSKEGLQSVVDDKEQVNTLSTKDLRNLFKLRSGTPSDTHDKLRCERCEIFQDDAETEALKLLPKKLRACRDLLDTMIKREDAAFFLKPMAPADHNVSVEEYEKIVKQPMDFGTIQKKIAQSLATNQPQPENEAPQEDAPTTGKASKSKQAAAAATYKSVSTFSKDVNRIFSNCLKVWEPETDEVAKAAFDLQAWWVSEWHALVPQLMSMTADDVEKKSSGEEGSLEDEILKCASSTLNERGENYQEQLGMPDEENMRSWSHHHSTDTVDDPIFRAAMRGYDSVSFVFGLEVTWSLIQQKKEEDEERQAMLELQAMQEMQEEEEEDDSAAVDNNKGDENPDQKEDVAMDDADENNSSDDDDGDDGSSSDSGSEEEASAIASNDNADGESSPTVKQEEGNDESRPEDPVAPSPGSATETEEEADLETEGASPVKIETSSPSGDKENAVPTSGVWTCDLCTLQNEASDKKCTACEFAKGRKKRRTSP